MGAVGRVGSSDRFASFDEHRLGLLLRGAVDVRAPRRGARTRQHYFVYPLEHHRPGLEREEPHRGLMSFLLHDPGTPGITPYSIEHGRLLCGGRDLEVVALPLEETKEPFFLREGGGGIANFDLEASCSVGCAFCPRSQARAARRTSWLASGTERDAVRGFLARHGRESLATLDQLSIVTGRFSDQGRFVAHVLAMLRAAREHGFAGDLYFASDQLEDEAAMEAIAAHTPRRVYYALTVESFERRAVLMPRRPAMDHRRILERSRRVFGRAWYNLVLGLDRLSAVREGIDSLAGIATPYVSVFSVYRRAHEALRAEGAHDLAYYQEVQRHLLDRFGRGVYMHDAPHYNVSNRALFPFPPERFAPS